MRIGNHDYEVSTEGSYIKIHFPYENAVDLLEDIELAEMNATHINMTDIVGGRLTNCWALVENTAGELDDMKKALNILGVEVE